MSITSYCPEMGDKTPAAQIEVRLSYDAKYFFLETTLQLEKIRGLTFVGVLSEADLSEQDKSDASKKQYKATKAAFEVLREKYICSIKRLLD